MSSVGMNFGRSNREKFNYLLISAICVSLVSIIIRLIAINTLEQDFFEYYELFYIVLGAGLGFMIAQLFIKAHVKSIRRGGI